VALCVARPPNSRGAEKPLAHGRVIGAPGAGVHPGSVRARNVSFAMKAHLLSSSELVASSSPHDAPALSGSGVVPVKPEPHGNAEA